MSAHLKTIETTVPGKIVMPNMLLIRALMRESLTAPWVLRRLATTATESPYWMCADASSRDGPVTGPSENEQRSLRSTRCFVTLVSNRIHNVSVPLHPRIESCKAIE